MKIRALLSRIFQKLPYHPIERLYYDRCRKRSSCATCIKSHSQDCAHCEALWHKAYLHTASAILAAACSVILVMATVAGVRHCNDFLLQCGVPPGWRILTFGLMASCEAILLIIGYSEISYLAPSHRGKLINFHSNAPVIALIASPIICILFWTTTMPDATWLKVLVIVVTFSILSTSTMLMSSFAALFAFIVHFNLSVIRKCTTP